MCKNDYCLRRDTTDCETDIGNELVITTRTQKMNKSRKRAIVNSDLNDLASKCLKGDETLPYQQVAHCSSALFEPNSAKIAEVSLQNDVMLAKGSPRGNTSLPPKHELVTTITKPEDSFDDNAYYYNNDEDELVTSQQKYDTYYTDPKSPEEFPVELTLPLNDSYNTNQIVQISCSSCKEVLEELKAIKNNQIQLNAEIGAIKTIAGGSQVDIRKINEQIVRIQHDTQTVLSNFQQTEENNELIPFGFKFPIITVKEVERLEEELGSNNTLKTAMVI